MTKVTALFVVGGGGFEPPKSETSDLQSDAFGHSAIRPNSVVIDIQALNWGCPLFFARI